MIKDSPRPISIVTVLTHQS